jgi:DNA-binding NarL/FixJ family response regulator
MKTPPPNAPMIHVALLESDPLQFVGFRALLEPESDLDLVSASLKDVMNLLSLDVALLVDHNGQDFLETISRIRAMRPTLPVLIVGPCSDHDTVLSALTAGAKGYVFDGAPPSEFSQAIRVVSKGLVWAPRQVLSTFVEVALTQRQRTLPGASDVLTNREKQVLTKLVSGLSNREIGVPLGIEERTVKAHIAKMMRKVGVQNRIALSVHAITHALVSSPQPS